MKDVEYSMSGEWLLFRVKGGEWKAILHVPSTVKLLLGAANLLEQVKTMMADIPREKSA